MGSGESWADLLGMENEWLYGEHYPPRSFRRVPLRTKRLDRAARELRESFNLVGFWLVHRTVRRSLRVLEDRVERKQSLENTEKILR
jgi:hypothetical protein